MVDEETGPQNYTEQLADFKLKSSDFSRMSL